jgi:hypothetical protein
MVREAPERHVNHGEEIISVALLISGALCGLIKVPQF